MVPNPAGNPITPHSGTSNPSSSMTAGTLNKPKVESTWKHKFGSCPASLNTEKGKIKSLCRTIDRVDEKYLNQCRYSLSPSSFVYSTWMPQIDKLPEWRIFQYMSKNDEGRFFLFIVGIRNGIKSGSIPFRRRPCPTINK